MTTPARERFEEIKKIGPGTPLPSYPLETLTFLISIVEAALNVAVLNGDALREEHGTPSNLDDTKEFIWQEIEQRMKK